MTLALGFDIETPPIKDGFHDGRELPDSLHCIVVRDFSDGLPDGAPSEYYHDSSVIRPRTGSLEDGVARLKQADVLVGYNITGFDIPMLEKVYRYELGEQRIFDCHAVTRMVHLSTMFARTAYFRSRSARGLRGEEREAKMEEAFPGRLMTPKGQFSLEAWGYRLRQRKGTFGKQPDSFDVFTQEMLEYCDGDVILLERVYDFLRAEGAKPGWPAAPDAACYVESYVDYILRKQTRHGVAFDEAGAVALTEKITAEHSASIARLRERFPARWRKKGKLVTPKRSAVSKKYPPGHPKHVNVQAGCPYQPIKLVEFNPASPQQRVEILKESGWVPDPDNYTENGLPVTDEDTIADLPFDYIPELMRYLLLNKRLGQVYTGKQAWLKLVTSDGKLHGGVHATGARTSRTSHFRPNLSQTPKNKSPFGEECRALFGPIQKRWVMLGVDASKLELCCLGHRLAKYDKGAFALELLQGDPHEQWRAASGLFYRENQKTLTYALLYGAGDKKLGRIVLMDWREAYEAGLTTEKPLGLAYAQELGAAVRAKLFSGVPALAEFVEACKDAFTRGWIRGIDGRVIPVSTEHGTVNDVLQSDGAIIMKYALVIAHKALTQRGWIWGRDYAFMLNSHDEWQLEVRPELAPEIGQVLVGAIVLAGRVLKVRMPLSGEFKIGKSWKETH